MNAFVFTASDNNLRRINIMQLHLDNQTEKACINMWFVHAIPLA